MLTIKDQLGDSIVLKKTPQRIVSIVPSQTELLYDLGLYETVVGITRFCIHPSHWHKNKTRIGGTKNINLEKIIALQPDLVLANKEENVQEQVDALRTVVPVWVSDIRTIAHALDMIRNIGLIVDKERKAEALVSSIESSFDDFKQASRTSIKTAYLIWKDPYMTIGGDTFISNMLEKGGFENVFKAHKRYPSVSVEDLAKKNPDLILLSSEPYPFKQKHIDKLSQQLPGKKIMLADGEIFSWYGSRMQLAANYFEHLSACVHSC